ncbi:hypothetical protein C8F01DRAFT_271727 [Mycena amicta]|nr:hypothetical protein C8F01DRAFT_271727 [Mycena amicta]
MMNTRKKYPASILPGFPSSPHDQRSASDKSSAMGRSSPPLRDGATANSSSNQPRTYTHPAQAIFSLTLHPSLPKHSSRWPAMESTSQTLSFLIPRNPCTASLAHRHMVRALPSFIDVTDDGPADDTSNAPSTNVDVDELGRQITTDLSLHPRSPDASHELGAAQEPLDVDSTGLTISNDDDSDHSYRGHRNPHPRFPSGSLPIYTLHPPGGFDDSRAAHHLPSLLNNMFPSIGQHDGGYAPHNPFPSPDGIRRPHSNVYGPAARANEHFSTGDDLHSRGQPIRPIHDVNALAGMHNAGHHRHPAGAVPFVRRSGDHFFWDTPASTTPTPSALGHPHRIPPPESQSSPTPNLQQMSFPQPMDWRGGQMELTFEYPSYMHGGSRFPPGFQRGESSRQGHFISDAAYPNASARHPAGHLDGPFDPRFIGHRGYNPAEATFTYTGDPSLVNANVLGHTASSFVAGVSSILNPPTHHTANAGPPPTRQSARAACRNHQHCPRCQRPDTGEFQWRYGPVSDKMLCSRCAQYEIRTKRPRPRSLPGRKSSGGHHGPRA